MSVLSNLILGTAQFGTNYGIANSTGLVSNDELKSILKLALAHGVDMLDTAIVYGDAESRIGELGVSDFKIVTKIPALPSAICDVYTWLLEHIRASLLRLRVPRLYGLLLHHPADLVGISSNQLLSALAGVRDSGLVEHVGASIYNPSDLDIHINTDIFDLVQAPLNILDRRAVDCGLIDRMHNLGIEVHIRSVFLQGLLLMPIALVPSYFKPWLHLLERWHSWCDELGVTPLQAALAHVRSSVPGAKIVIGCDNPKQFVGILEASLHPPLLAPTELSYGDPHLVNPTLWSST